MRVISDLDSLKLDFYLVIIKELLDSLNNHNYRTSLLSAFNCMDYISIPLAKHDRNTKQAFYMFINEYMSAANPFRLNIMV
jgi:hypothetical protein